MTTVGPDVLPASFTLKNPSRRADVNTWNR